MQPPSIPVVPDAVLLYVGSGPDAYPFCFPHLWTGVVREYVYVDANCGSNNEPNYKGQSGAVMLLPLQRCLEQWCFLRVRLETVIQNAYSRLVLSDGRIIHFFTSCIDADLASGNVPGPLRELMQRTTPMLVKGFMPCDGVFEALPRLGHIHLTDYPGCDCP